MEKTKKRSLLALTDLGLHQGQNLVLLSDIGETVPASCHDLRFAIDATCLILHHKNGIVTGIGIFILVLVEAEAEQGEKEISILFTLIWISPRTVCFNETQERR
ncbi:hypothetical protein Mapa_012634 [Marchantia paleacea]|nr:hypothetical protein Mapa_012634 [Marchantia paleacea]